MLKIDFKSFNLYVVILLTLSIFALIFEISHFNKIFWLILLTLIILLKFLNLKYKKFLSLIFSIFAIYLQFRFDYYSLSKDFFINILIILLILKFLELKVKQDQYFFNFMSVFIAISSLTYGQDFLSSLNSLLLIIFSITHLYLLNQSELLKINYQNLSRFFFISLLTIPLIIFIYIIFPRQEIRINLLTSKEKSLGIPDKIQLGTFDRISNSNEKVFTYNDNNSITENKYFRVRIFDLLNDDKDWLFFKDSFLKKEFEKINKDNLNKKNDYVGRIILDPHNKKWIPIIKGTLISDNKISYNKLNLTATSSNKIINKEEYKLSYNPTKMIINKNMIINYTRLPKTISPKLKEWATKNYNASNNDNDYIQKILNQFSSGEFYYSLKPADYGNNYAKFFLETKEGYCEYYAGTFAILTRLAGIPTRIVTGFYGGEYNRYGNFYTINQSDAHAWVEIWNKKNDWIRIDPTAYIPKENIKDANNFELNNIINLNNNNSRLLVQFNKIFNYISYLDYKWTNTFTQYNQNSREVMLNKFINKSYLFDATKNISSFIIIFLIIFITYKIFFNKKILYKILIHKFKKNGINIKSYHTHQDIFKMLKLSQQNELKKIFIFYEKIMFQNIKTNVTDRLAINIKILRYYFFNY
tara:strand:+ start:2773 stop:4698 length:1926 start_codon:yes stop_codon:yes gene_type:complete